MIRMPGGKQKRGEKMKRIVMFMVLVTMLVSLGGCFWGYEGRDRDGGYGRGGGHDDRGGERGGEHEDRH
jgi:hypothetical protein